jgi:hypothetical protein
LVRPGKSPVTEFGLAGNGTVTRPEMEPSQELPCCLFYGRPESVALVPLVIAEECGQDLIVDLLAGRGYSTRDKAHDIGIGIQVHQVIRIGHGELPQYQPIRLKENLHRRSFRYRHATVLF